jgi:hypothetical protein
MPWWVSVTAAAAVAAAPSSAQRGGGLDGYTDMGAGYCTTGASSGSAIANNTSDGGQRVQSWLCDGSGTHPDPCSFTLESCAALCTPDRQCTGFMLQDMSIYNEPFTCNLVTSTMPTSGGGHWIVQHSGSGRSISGHDSETRDHCYKKSARPPPPPPPPPRPPPPSPAWRPRLAASLLPRPHGGHHNFSFMLYGGSFLARRDAFSNLTRAMRRFGVGNGFDPLTVPMAAAAETGWPVSMNPPQGGNLCFQVPECPNNMSVAQAQDLLAFDQANVYHQIQFGEWDWYFAQLQPGKNGGNEDWWHAVFPDSKDFQKYFTNDATPFQDAKGRRLYGFQTMPGSREEAYAAYRSYCKSPTHHQFSSTLTAPCTACADNKRIAWLSSTGAVPYSSGAKIYSMTQVPGGAALVIYAALWNSEGSNAAATVNTAVELQTGRAANLAFAMARGSSRRFGKPWTVQPSGWGYGPRNGVCGPLVCTPKGGQPQARACTAQEMSDGASCRGAEASHSYSWYWRVWHHVWFAGAAAVTEEGPAMGLFGCDQSGSILTDFATLTRHGRQAQAFQRTTRRRDRGAPLTPLGVVLDKHLGYGTAGVADASWSVLPFSVHDRMFADLVEQQLYLPSGAQDDVLQTTPHGDIADFVLSDASADTFALYPVLLLAGDQHFTDGLAARLLGAMQSQTTHELVVHPFHLGRMGAGMIAKLNATGKLRVVSPKPLQSTGRVPAIAPVHLDSIARDHLPAIVDSVTAQSSGAPVNILWQVNAQATGGFVLELSNPHGVTKAPCAPMELHGGTVRARILLQVDAGKAVNWFTEDVVAAGPLHKGDAIVATITAGNTTYLEFSP